MPQPTWRKIIERKKIPEEQGMAWTRVLDYVTPGKLMKIEVVTDDNPKPAEVVTEVVADDKPKSAEVVTEAVTVDKPKPAITGKWKPADFRSDCTADGDYSGKEPVGKQGGPALLSSAPLGALIARIGGSTADQSIDTATAPNRLVFSVGRYCVFLIPPTPNGALYLSVNDSAPNMVRLSGDLFVDVYEAL